MSIKGHDPVHPVHIDDVNYPGMSIRDRIAMELMAARWSLVEEIDPIGDAEEAVIGANALIDRLNKEE